MCAILRDIQKRKAKRELDAKLIEGLMSGPAEPVTREDCEAIELEVLERHARGQDSQ